MPYSSEVVQRARNRLAQAKEDRESENRQHLAEAYARVPRIKEIDMLLRRTMAQAAQAAFLQGSDGRELLEKARIQNLELQQERAILARENFEEGYLDETPICEICGGTGLYRLQYVRVPAGVVPSGAEEGTCRPYWRQGELLSVPAGLLF